MYLLEGVYLFVFVLERVYLYVCGFIGESKPMSVCLNR